jgi:hypothetical protein
MASAQPLPEGWWQQDSPESVLAKAESITRDLSYFRGSKAYPMGDKAVSLEFFQRKTANGKVETKLANTKLMYGHGITSADYDLESGHYFYESGQLIKSEYEQTDEFQQRIASKFDHPYEYQMRKAERLNTNDCIVIARITTAPVMDALINEEYYDKDRFPSYMRTPMYKKMLVDHYPSEQDYYIRKSDGIIMGFLQRNKAGVIGSDYALWDVVQINVPIPDEEFTIPKAPVRVAHSLNEWNDMDWELVKSAAAEVRSKYAREIQSRNRIILAVMAVPSILLLSILWYRFRRKTPNPVKDR